MTPITAPNKYGVRRAISRERKSWATVTNPPPRNIPIGIEPHAKNRYTLFTRPKRCEGMMLWRSETVIVFHKIEVSPVNTPSTQTKCQDEVIPINTQLMGPIARESHNEGPLPIFAEIFGAVIPPTIAPIAPAVPSTANSKTLVCKTS